MLLVDDDEDTREMYSWSLGSRGYEVITAGSVLNALGEAGMELPDIVVTDFTLPGMSGLDLAARLREAPETSCPIVLLSGREFSGEEREQALRLCDSILLKPILPDLLGEEIRRVLILSTSHRLRQQLTAMRARLQNTLTQSESVRDAAREIVAAADAVQGARSRTAVLIADDQAHYVAANDMACVVTGLSQEQLLSKSVWELTPGIDAESGQRLWREFIARGTVEGTYALSPDGTDLVTAWFTAAANVAPHLHVSLLAPVPAAA